MTLILIKLIGIRLWIYKEEKKHMHISKIYHDQIVGDVNKKQQCPNISLVYHTLESFFIPYANY